MAEVEKPKEVIKVQPKDQPKESSAPKTSQSAFDKVMEQQKTIQQSPALQSKFTDQGTSDQKVREISKWQEKNEERGRKDDKEDDKGRDKLKQKEKGSITITREAITRGGEKSGFGGSSGGQGKGGDKGGYSSDMAKKEAVQKKLLDARGLLGQLGQSSFAGKLAQASQATMTLKPEQMQAIVNSIVAAIQVGKNELGEKELRLILKESVFQGLRLRFTSKNGKVSVQFETSSRKVKDLFSAESAKIKAALEEKGVVVQEIKVS